MTLSRRLLIALAAMVIASFIAGLLWRGAFDVRIPSYLSGVVGGLSALAVWEALRSRK